MHPARSASLVLLQRSREQTVHGQCMGRTTSHWPLTTPEATTSSSSLLKRWWTRNARNVTLHDMITGAARLLEGGGRLSSLPAIL